MFCLCFACVFYVCQNPKILFSQNKILDFCLTQVLRKQNVCQTYVKHVETSVSHWLQVCTRFGFQIGNCLTQGGRPTHVSHMLQISQTCFALCVTYVSIIFHLCFVCVPHMFCLMFDICFIYVSHMFRLCFTYVFTYA